MIPKRRIQAITMAVLLATTPALVSAQSLPMRQTPIPRTTDSVPHMQLGIEPVQELSDELLKRVADLPGVILAPTRISMPGAVGFQLEEDVPLAHPEAIVRAREFAHIHPDGSLHASLEHGMAQAAIEAGWAVWHPWADQREGWQGFVMIFTPNNQEELDVVLGLVQQSYAYVTGRDI